MATAGVRAIQPGIESLSTRILKLMRKGATRLINVRLLKWAAYYGMTVNGTCSAASRVSPATTTRSRSG